MSNTDITGGNEQKLSGSLAKVAPKLKKKRQNKPADLERQHNNPQNNLRSSTYFHKFVRWTLKYTEDYHKINLTKIIHVLRKSIWILFLDRDTWSRGIFFLVVGLIVSFVAETMNQGPNYNTAVLLLLMGSMAYPNFPQRTVRPQLLLALVSTMSFLLDLFFLAKPTRKISDRYKGAIGIMMASKLLALYNMLWLSKQAKRAKKYILR